MLVAGAFFSASGDYELSVRITGTDYDAVRVALGGRWAYSRVFVRLVGNLLGCAAAYDLVGE